MNIFRYLRGYVQIQVYGVTPAAFLNECAGAGIKFWDAQPVDELTLRVKVRRSASECAIKAAARAGCEVTDSTLCGAPVYLKRVTGRAALIAGAAAVAGFILWSSLHIWEIEVTGNETVSSFEIMRTLNEIGVGTGSFWPSFSSDDIRSQALARIPSLSWLTVNVYGSRAVVKVRERIPVPEIVDEGQPTKVVAEKAGIITEIRVLRGKPLAEKHMTVLPGDVLVPGTVDVLNKNTHTVHAMAEVWARTWYELTAERQTYTEAKEYSGKKHSRLALEIGKNRINFYHNSGISGTGCDKIIKEYNLGIEGIFKMPVTLVRETVSEYMTVPVPENTELAVSELEAMLAERLKKEIGETGSITSQNFSVSEADGLVRVTLRAECLEDIAKTVPLNDSELVLVAKDEMQGE